MLLKILQMFQERESLSVTELCSHFRADESAISAMLNQLQKKGKISKLPVCQKNCSGCGVCYLQNQDDIYRLNRK